MDAKFTKGPWVAEMRYIHDIEGNARVEVIAGPKSEEHRNSAVASVCYSHKPCTFYIDDKEEAEANASLIAAAPELYEALCSSKAQMEMAADCVENGRYDEAILHLRSLSRMRDQALAKATGDQP